MINSTSKTDTLLRPDLIAGRTTQKSTSIAAPTDTGSDSDTVTASSQETLQSLLKSQPETRSDVVAMGQRLLVDGNYPPKEIIRKLSEILVNSVDLTQ